MPVCLTESLLHLGQRVSVIGWKEVLAKRGKRLLPNRLKDTSQSNIGVIAAGVTVRSKAEKVLVAAEKCVSITTIIKQRDVQIVD